MDFILNKCISSKAYLEFYERFGKKLPDDILYLLNSEYIDCYYERYRGFYYFKYKYYIIEIEIDKQFKNVNFINILLIKIDRYEILCQLKIRYYKKYERNEMYHPFYHTDNVWVT